MYQDEFHSKIQSMEKWSTIKITPDTLWGTDSSCCFAWFILPGHILVSGFLSEDGPVLPDGHVLPLSAEDSNVLSQLLQFHDLAGPGASLREGGQNSQWSFK